MFKVSTLDFANLPRTASGEVDFEQDFFGSAANLTVSGQLNVETFCCAMSKVYTFGPTFRAENSNTRRHLAEFWMVEPEIAFADLAADADLAEDFLKYIFAALLNECPDDMAFFEKRVDKECVSRLEHMIDSGFERMTYTEAVERVKAANRKWEFPVEWGANLQAEHERYLAEELVGRPVVIMDYPAEIKAFYMRLNDDGRTVAAMDIVAQGDRRARRRLAARGAPRRPRCAHPPPRARARRLLVVPGPPPLRHRAARGLRAGLRARDPVRDRGGEHPRRHPLPARAPSDRLLTRPLIAERSAGA